MHDREIPTKLDKSRQSPTVPELYDEHSRDIVERCRNVAELSRTWLECRRTESNVVGMSSNGVERSRNVVEWRRTQSEYRRMESKVVGISSRVVEHHPTLSIIVLF